VPPTIRFVLDGEMPPFLLAKDLILQVSLQNNLGYIKVSLYVRIFSLQLRCFIHCDICLQIIGEISVSGATYKSMEFVGSTVESLTVCSKFILINELSYNVKIELIFSHC
jgi:3-isopropylmalate/(R)-2-methylmalate dehydratase large subunit